MKDAIFNEVFLDFYDKWRPGIYYSKRGILKIKEMHNVHLVNAIEDLLSKREVRLKQILNLDNDGEMVDHIKECYSNSYDVISLKISELQTELNLRDL